MMKKTRMLLLMVALVSVATSTNAQNHSTNIKVQAMNMGNAFMRNDLKSLVQYMHPNIIAFAGGKESMQAKMDSAFQGMKRFKVRFKRYHVGNPGEILNYKGQLQAILPQSTTLTTPLGEMTMETSMIVISADNGKNWWFIDTNVYQSDKLKSIMPDLSPNLVIPPRKKPKMGPVGRD